MLFLEFISSKVNFFNPTTPLKEIFNKKYEMIFITLELILLGLMVIFTILNKIISQERSASLMNFFLSNNSAEQLSLDFENQRLVTDAALENITGWRTFSGKMSWRRNFY